MDMQFDFDEVLDYPLPKGFHFVDPDEYDMDKVSKCCWKGFDHEQNEGPWNHQYEQSNYLLAVAPLQYRGIIVAWDNQIL